MIVILCMLALHRKFGCCRRRVESVEDGWACVFATRPLCLTVHLGGVHFDRVFSFPCPMFRRHNQAAKQAQDWIADAEERIVLDQTLGLLLAHISVLSASLS